MKNSAYIIILIFAAILLNSSKCENNKKATSKDVTLTGKYKSLKGVMNNLSCYCYDVGYLTTEAGKRIAVCFKDIKSSEINCKNKLIVTGNFQTIKHNSGDNDPCPSGERKIFMVKSYSCN